MSGHVTLIQNNWTAGEIAPTLEGRVDLPAYSAGARVLENFLPTAQGWVRKRPGTNYRGRTRGDAKARLIPFLSSTGTRYLFEVTNLYLRVRDMTGAQVGSDLSVPYQTADLAALKWAVNKGEAWLAHSSYAPRKVTLSGTFSVASPTFTGDRTFAAAGDYPGGVAFLQGRSLFLRFGNRPAEVCLSRARDAAAGTDRYTDFDTDVGDDGTINASDAIVIEKSDPSAQRLLWAVAQKRLILASDAAVSQDNGQLVTPATFDFATVARSAPVDIQGALADSLVVYVGRGWTLRGLLYTNEGGGFQDINLSQSAGHILLPGVVDFAVQSSPQTIVWLVRSDGVLVSCSIDFAAGVVAFARHPMGAGAVVESVAVSESSSEGDTVWITVLRGSIRTIESFTLPDPAALDLPDEHYVDSAVVYSGAATATISGLDHLEGETVQVLGDGKIMAPKVVASGAVTLAKEVTKAHVGLAVQSKLSTLRPNLPSNGTSQGKKYRIEEITARIYRTLGGQISIQGTKETSSPIPFLYILAGEYKYGDPVPLFTGDKGPKSVPGSLDSNATVLFEHSEPAPCNLLALIYRVAIEEV